MSENEIDNIVDEAIRHLVEDLGLKGSYIDIPIPEGRKGTVVSAANRATYHRIRKPLGNLNGAYSTSLTARSGFLRVTLNHEMKTNVDPLEYAKIEAEKRLDAMVKFLVDAGWKLDELTNTWIPTKPLLTPSYLQSYNFAWAVKAQIESDLKLTEKVAA